MHLKMIAARKYSHKKQKAITRYSRNREKTRSAKPDDSSAQQVPRKSQLGNIIIGIYTLHRVKVSKDSDVSFSEQDITLPS